MPEVEGLVLRPVASGTAAARRLIQLSSSLSNSLILGEGAGKIRRGRQGEGAVSSALFFAFHLYTCTHY